MLLKSLIINKKIINKYAMYAWLELLQFHFFLFMNESHQIYIQIDSLLYKYIFFYRYYITINRIAYINEYMCLHSFQKHFQKMFRSWTKKIFKNIIYNNLFVFIFQKTANSDILLIQKYLHALPNGIDAIEIRFTKKKKQQTLEIR